jgi:hypothetical protein
MTNPALDQPDHTVNETLSWLLEPGQRSPAVARAIGIGSEFLLSWDLAAADYPYTERIKPPGFPLGFRSATAVTSWRLWVCWHAWDWVTIRA